MMPWPARMTGRWAELIKVIGSPVVKGVEHGAVASQSKAAEPVCASLVMSTWTGPGRPLLATAKASRITGAISLVRVTSQLHLVMGSVYAGDVGLLPSA